MSKYFISCFSGAKNMGDEFILKCLVKNIQDYDKDSKILVSSLNPEYTESTIENNIIATEWHGIGITKKALKNMSSLKKAIKNVDYVVIGGGGLLQDVHSVETIPRYLISAVFAKLFNKKVIYYSMGIGPISNKLLIRLVRDISNKFVDHITVRDESSKKYLKNIGVTTKIEVTADPVFSISNYIPSSKKENKKVKVGISFRQFKTNKRTEHEIEKLIGELDKQNKQIILFPLDYDEDKFLCNRLRSKFNNINVIDNYNTIEDLVSPLSQLDFMISMRLHGIITCASYGIPSIAISYDPKVTNIQSKIGMSDYLINVEDFNSSVCLEKFQKIESTLDKIKPTLIKQVSIENTKIESGFKNSIEYAEKHNKKVSTTSCLIYFLKLFTPQILKKVNKLIKHGN